MSGRKMRRSHRGGWRESVKLYFCLLVAIWTIGVGLIFLAPWLAWKMPDDDWVFSTSERVRRWLNGGKDA